MEDFVSIAQELVASGLSDDELLAKLGESASESFGFEDTSPEEKKQAGLAWWTSHGPELRTLVCRVADDRDASSALVKDLVQVVFTAIGAKFGMGVATYAATIAVRRTLAGWCRNETMPTA